MKRIIALLLCACLLTGAGSFGAAAADKVYALTMGVHKYSANHTVVDGSDIAEVRYLRHKDGSEGSANHIYDVEEGEVFTLTTSVKEGQSDKYVFLAWLDINSEIVSEETSIEVVMDRSRAYFATYVEVLDRHVVSYRISDGEGSVSLSSDKELFPGKGCASVLHGASVTVKFTPAKGYSAYALTVDGARVQMLPYTFRTFLSEAKDMDVKGMFRSLLNYIKFLIGKDATYTIPEVLADTLVEVRFIKSSLQRTKKTY